MVKRRIGDFFKAMKERNRIRKDLKEDYKAEKRVIKDMKSYLKQLKDFEKRVKSSPKLDAIQKGQYLNQIGDERNKMMARLNEANLKKKEIRKKKGLF